MVFLCFVLREEERYVFVYFWWCFWEVWEWVFILEDLGGKSELDIWVIEFLGWVVFWLFIFILKILLMMGEWEGNFMVSGF